MSAEQFLPTRWILHGVSRESLAEHLKKLRRLGGNALAKQCVRQLLWAGAHPARWRNADGSWTFSGPIGEYRKVSA